MCTIAFWQIRRLHATKYTLNLPQPCVARRIFQHLSIQKMTASYWNIRMLVRAFFSDGSLSIKLDLEEASEIKTEPRIL